MSNSEYLKKVLEKKFFFYLYIKIPKTINCVINLKVRPTYNFNIAQVKYQTVKGTYLKTFVNVLD